MIIDSKKFVRKYATIYTSILAVVLVVPFLLYTLLLLKIDETKVKLALHDHAIKIISSMQNYNNREGIYNFPRCNKYKAALYTREYKEIFSLLDFEPNSFIEGVYHEKSRYHLIYPLPDNYYFGSKYLVISTEHVAYDIYIFALTVISVVLIVLFFFSLLLLRNFSKPFRILNRKLDNFIKDSMHEINTPLSIININSDLCVNKYGENKYLQRIKSASKTLATIYDDMNYLIKKGTVEHRIEEINMSQFIQGRADYFQVIAKMQAIDFSLDIESDIYYKFSKTKLQRIVDNTLSNAIKYSNGEANIDINLHLKKKKIVFSVRDYGVGIVNVDKIFSRYYRENESKGGFGIGLNIVKGIIDEEGIKLEIDSTVGEGSCFIYTFSKK